MTTDQDRRDDFEGRLLHELRSLVVSQPSTGPERPLRTPLAWIASRPRRRLALVGGLVALLAVTAGAGVPFLSGGAAPAYAVSTNDDGTVTVEINSLSDAAGLQRKLHEAGVRAVVQYLPPGKACKEPWFTEAPPEGSPLPQGITPVIKGGVEKTSNGHTRFTVSRNLGADETLVIMTQAAAGGGGQPGATIAVSYAKGEVKPCEVVDAPAGSQPFGAPPLGAGNLHTEGGRLGPAWSTSEAGSTTNHGSGSAVTK